MSTGSRPSVPCVHFGIGSRVTIGRTNGVHDANATARRTARGRMPALYGASPADDAGPCVVAGGRGVSFLPSMEEQLIPQSRAERLIALGRAVLATASIGAIYLDPLQPDRYPVVTYTLLVG